MPRARAALAEVPTAPSDEGTDAEGFFDPKIVQLGEDGEPITDASEQVEETVADVHDISAPRLPKFERNVVAGQRIVVTGGTKLEDPEAPVLKIGDIFQTLGEYRVIGVAHEENREGDLERIVKVRPIKAEIVPFDKTDPGDDGVVRGTVR